jgi:hypothetical protein
MKAETNDDAAKSPRGCNVSSRFNFTVGGLAIAAALLIGYLACLYWFR